MTGAPQLRLSHTGYEIISFNDQTPDDNLPVSTKLSWQNSSRYNGIDVLNLEKAESIDDEPEGLVLPVQQHKRHYDSHRSTADSKATADIRRNTIDPSVKGSSAIPSEKTNLYLAVGIPTRFEHSSSRTKESSNAFASSEVTNTNIDGKNSAEDSRQEKIVTWTNNNPRINDKKTRTSTKLTKSVGNRGSDKVSMIFDSDFDLSDAKEDSKLEKITALVADAHRALDQVDAKSDSEEKQERIDTKPAFPTVGKLPTIQIHRQRSFYIPSKSPAMFSPIYPSGFDIVTGNFAKKSVLPVNEPTPIHSTSVRLESQNTKNRKYADVEIEARKKLMGNAINEISNGPKEFGKSHQKERVPSLMMLKNIINNMKHNIFNPRNVNRSPLTGLLPMAGTSLYVSPLSVMLQQPLRTLRPSETHLEFNSMPMVTNHIEHNHSNGDLSIEHPQGHLEEIMSNSVIDPPKMHQLDNYLDNKYLDFKANDRIVKSGSKADFVKINSPKFHPTIRSLAANQSTKELTVSSVGSPKGSLVIDIVHEAAPEDSEESTFDNNNEDTTKDVHEMQDSRQASSSVSPRSSCKRMKPGTPPFYQFLTKFGDIVLENARKYETSLQVRDSAIKLIEVAKKKNSEYTADL